ncbi:MAG: hypothetical protein ACERKD_19305 [Prolixibacteraceae bacterium]
MMARTMYLAWLLRHSQAEQEVIKSKRKALSIYHQTRKSVRWYQLQTNQQHVLENDFSVLAPCLNKQKVFSSIPLISLIQNNKKRIGAISLSSGASGAFSIGFSTRKDLKRASVETDVFLNLFFNARKNNTVVINASAMGVRAYTNHVCCDTGPRIDLVLHLLMNVAPAFDKVFVIGDPVFIKSLVEESVRKGFEWDKQAIYLISGGEWLPESLRTYVHGLIGKSAQQPEMGFWSCIYGLTELGYPLFFETADLVVYRSALSKSKKKQESPLHMLCTTPSVYYYRPSSYYLEELQQASGTSHLAFTMLNKKRMVPMVRYDTGDVGRLIDSKSVPDKKYPLPLVEFWGRDQNWLEIASGMIYVNDIKEIIFSLFEICPFITGYFTLNSIKDKAILMLQLKKGVSENAVNAEVLEKAFLSNYSHQLEVSLVEYMQMGAQMELDFERKFKHLNTEQ